VFVSSDRDSGAFDEYFKEMPWLALPFSDKKTQSQLSQKFKIQGIPSLVILNSEGQLITANGRSEVSSDPKGDRFPWAPKPLFEALDGKFIDKDGKDYSLNDIKANNVIGFYFSGHWCGPCQMFTPELVKFYNKLKGDGKSFEIVFVSSDRDQQEFNGYFGGMPWKALPFGDSRIQQLKQKYSIRGIPALVMVDNTGKLITQQGRSLVEEDPTGYPWNPKALTPLGKSCIDAINSSACLLLFPSSTNFDDQKNVINGIAEEYYKKFEEKKEDHPLAFLYDSNNNDPLIPRICQAFGIPSSRPLLCILDAPSQMKYIHQGEVTETTIRTFIENFLAEKLTGIPLE